VTSNIRGYGGAQQKKCNAKSDDEWDLPVIGWIEIPQCSSRAGFSMK